MSERVASCGSLYDSTNLLLQYCNNGKLLLISPSTHIPEQTQDLNPVVSGSVTRNVGTMSN